MFIRLNSGSRLIKHTEKSPEGKLKHGTMTNIKVWLTTYYVCRHKAPTCIPDVAQGQVLPLEPLGLQQNKQELELSCLVRLHCQTLWNN